jgi:hypothetical protein
MSAPKTGNDGQRHGRKEQAVMGADENEELMGF